MNDKVCPLTREYCCGGKCGWWCYGECAVFTLAHKTEEAAHELYYIRKELENR